MSIESLPRPKVICLGLGRTGTTSLMAALDQLGFGPCYHMFAILKNQDANEINTWYNLGQGSATIDDMRTLLKDYNSVLDFPAAMFYDKLYEAYPDAKFILTTRDPAKWEASMKATILTVADSERVQPNTDTDSFVGAIQRWSLVDMQGRYHQGRLRTETQAELLRHNRRVKDTIPADKLLVYEVSQGWEPLVEFLGVEKPDTPFPHLNDTAEFKKRVEGLLAKSQ